MARRQPDRPPYPDDEPEYGAAMYREYANAHSTAASSATSRPLSYMPGDDNAAYDGTPSRDYDVAYRPAPQQQPPASQNSWSSDVARYHSHSQSQSQSQNAATMYGLNSPNTYLTSPTGMSPPHQSFASSYNPQQYAQQTSPNLNMSMGMNVNPTIGRQHTQTGVHQPYVPAAYQTTTPTAYVAPSFGYDSYHKPPPPPPIPPKPSQLAPSATAPYPQQNYPPALPQASHSLGGNIPAHVLPTLPPRSMTYQPPAPPPPPNHAADFPSYQYVTASQYPNMTNAQHPPKPRLQTNLSSSHRLPDIPYFPGMQSPSGLTGMSPQATSSIYSTFSPMSGEQSSQATSASAASRPLPGIPAIPEELTPRSEEQVQPTSMNGSYDDDMYREIEDLAMGRPSARGPLAMYQERHPSIHRHPSLHDTPDVVPRPGALFSGQKHRQSVIEPDAPPSFTRPVANSPAPSERAGYSDSSDAEGAAGLEMMRQDEEREHFGLIGSNTFSSTTSVPAFSRQESHTPRDDSSDSDVPFDMSTLSGDGLDSVGYFPGSETTPSERYTPVDPHSPFASSQPSQVSDRSSEMVQMVDDEEDYAWITEDQIHPFPSFEVRTDTADTGGLKGPQNLARRLSFEDGDELAHTDVKGMRERPLSMTLKARGSPVRTPSRPLPKRPDSVSMLRRQSRHSLDRNYPNAPDAYNQAHAAAGMTAVQKANSTGGVGATPLAIVPGRSATDADQKKRQTLNHSTSLSGSTIIADLLPAIPAVKRRKFAANKITIEEFDGCREPWALSSIYEWIKTLAEHDADLKEAAVTEAFIALFLNKVLTMNTADAEVLSAYTVAQFKQAGALVEDEEWLKFGAVQLSGVLFQLSGCGCYSSHVHTIQIPGRCYSYKCMRTLKKIELATHVVEPSRHAQDWASYWKLTREDIENVPKKELERQNVLHEIVTSEEYFMEQLDVVRRLYRDGLAQASEAIMAKNRLESFSRAVFGRIDPVKTVNQDFLLSQLKYAQAEQGPWIRGFASIFREWIRKARSAYVDYASDLPNASFQVRREADRNIFFRQFLDQVRENEQSRRLDWDTYLKAPVTRLQRYSLLLGTVLKCMPIEGEERANLELAIEEIKTVTLECDSRVAEMTKRSQIAEMQHKLKLRPGMEKVQLSLNQHGREIIFQGDLIRKGTNSFTWLDTKAILFDNYLVLAKPLEQRDAAGALKATTLDVSKLPIPMDLLAIESTNDDPVVRTSMKGAILDFGASNRLQSPNDTRLQRLGSPGSHTSLPPLSNVPTSSSMSSLTLVNEASNDKVMYPFKVKHLGKSGVHILYAPTAQNRKDWCDKIVQAKTKHAEALYKQNAEPFKLNVLCDTAFGYSHDSALPPSVLIPETPIARALTALSASLPNADARPNAICRAPVFCATTFSPTDGRYMIAVGTGFGVFISDYHNPRGYWKAIVNTNVTQIAVLEDFNIFLVLANGALIAYQLDAVMSSDGRANGSESTSLRQAPQKLSGSKEVNFFVTGRLKDRMLVVYKKRDNLSSRFKVLEPVYQKAATGGRTRWGVKKGLVETFRDFDEFYIPAECYSMNLFHSTIAVSTTRGIEVLNLERKQPISIPDTKVEGVKEIAASIASQKPLGMFRLSPEEFLLCYEEVGIYVDKHGEISRTVVMEFVGRAKQAALYKQTYLILVDASEGFVEIRNAFNGRLRQIISGRDVRLLDDGLPSGGSLSTLNANGGQTPTMTMAEQQVGTVKVSMQHPMFGNCHVIFELVLNEESKE